MTVNKLNSPPYIIEKGIIHRFDQRKTIFGRMLNDEEASFYRRSMYINSADIINQKKEGYSHIEFARTLASWTVYDHFHGAFSCEKLTEDRNVMKKPDLGKYSMHNPAMMADIIKETAKMYGASLVGICKLNPWWIYSYDIDSNKIEIPKIFKYVVVIAIAMDPVKIRTSPAYLASTETAIGYSRMAFCIASLAEFIRYLGYHAIPIGNDIALSIPLAIDAGLGELGRHGLLITPDYGPCVRLCKLFTDLPLIEDKPIEFGIRDYCRNCTRCAEACEVEAITKKKDPSFDIACSSNNRGILRWAVDHDRCYQFWIDNGNDCSSCIAACPYTKNSLEV